MDPHIVADLQSAESEMAEARLAQQEFHLATSQQQWTRAEDARSRTLSHMEASLDAFMRAARRMAAYAPRSGS